VNEAGAQEQHRSGKLQPHWTSRAQPTTTLQERDEAVAQYYVSQRS
jgi:hypothetical protein